MKKLLIIIIVSILYSYDLKAQWAICNPNEVSTNPANPSNPLHPEFVNYFNWLPSVYNVYYQNSHRTFPNPYWNNQGGVVGLDVLKDNKPNDGWELLYLDLGLDKHGAQNQVTASGHLWFALYNKYRSFIRIFIAVDLQTDKNMIELSLGFPTESQYYKTALLGTAEKIKKPLKNFDNSIAITTAQKFNNSGHWHYADFAVNYDPCTCNKPVDDNGQEIDASLSRIEFLVAMLDVATINLTGTSTGTINKINKASGNSGSDNWNSFYGAAVKKPQGAIEAGNKTYKAFGVFKNEVSQEGSSDSDKKAKAKSGLESLGKFLTNEVPALKYVPYVAEGLSIIDFFVGGGKKRMKLLFLHYQWN